MRIWNLGFKNRVRHRLYISANLFVCHVMSCYFATVTAKCTGPTGSHQIGLVIGFRVRDRA